MTELERVEQAAFEMAEAREKLEAAIRKAHKHPLRAIAEAAGMSHEKVRGIIRRDQT